MSEAILIGFPDQSGATRGEARFFSFGRDWNIS
jgi:hypothetical protein